MSRTIRNRKTSKGSKRQAVMFHFDSEHDMAWLDARATKNNRSRSKECLHIMMMEKQNEKE